MRIRSYHIVKDLDLLAKKAVPYAIGSVIAPFTDRPARLGGISVPHDAFTWSPFYEAALLTGIKRTVQEGDSVVIIGGGYGVSTTVAAQQAGADGRVWTFEGSMEAVESCRATAAYNDVDDRCDIKHAVVGEEIQLRSDRGDARSVAARDLPACDVLVLDCEGAEATILDEVGGESDESPRDIVVETHGIYDAHADKIQPLLEARGYAVVKRTVDHRSYGVHVLVAMQSPSTESGQS